MNVNAPTVTYEVIERKDNLDCAEFSICPNCSLHIIKLDDGCDVCGWSDENKLLGDKQNSPLSKKNSSTLSKKISIPCTIKQPQKPEVKGVIKQVWRDRFTVYIPSDDSTVTVSKLLVYPDFSKSPKGYRDPLVGQIPPTRKAAPPSKTRRKKGEGTGYIYRRTITRRGKQYRESYYRYRDESGKLRSKYIPQTLLDRVQEAESRSLPVTDVLKLLGGLEISRGEQFSTSNDGYVQNKDKSDELISISRGEQASPPSTKNLKRAKRQQGYGAGYIECRKVKRGSKLYSQFWYHYEFWQDGARLVKKSRYIPKRMLALLEKLEAQKVPVRKILEVLGVKNE